jgi:hypothetical protein
MKFNLIPLVLTVATAVAAVADDSAPDFTALKAETESMKNQLLRESKSIDTKLRSIVEHKPEKESLVQLQSMEQLQRNRHKFEEESANLIEANKVKVEKYKQRFDELLAKLREDVNDKNYGSSFLQVSEAPPLDVDQLFAEARAKVEKLHFVARDIRKVAKHWNKGAESPPPATTVAVKEDNFDSIEV